MKIQGQKVGDTKDALRVVDLELYRIKRRIFWAAVIAGATGGFVGACLGLLAATL